jgi:hypothetical protein
MRLNQMTASTETSDPRELALTWLWSQPPDVPGGPLVDLRALDQWRQGLLEPERAAQVKRLLADDPRAMQMLVELVAADRDLQEWESCRHDQISRRHPWVPVRQILERLGQLVDAALPRLADPAWARGLVAAAISVLLVVLLIPLLTEPDLSRQLDRAYAELEIPPEKIALPWGPKIAMRGGDQRGPAVQDDGPGQLARQSFQAGVADGVEQIQLRDPGFELSSSHSLQSARPDCAEGDARCQQWDDLSYATGRWALAAYLECRGSSAAEQDNTLRDLLPRLQRAWRETPAEHPLGTDVQNVRLDQQPCSAVNGMLRAWGR